MKTLIIDDQVFELALLAPALTHHGVNVVGRAKNVDEARSEFLALEPSVVIIDVRFNNEKALNLCRELREINPNLGLVIIADTPDLRILGITRAQIPSGSQLILKSSVGVVELIYQAIALSILSAKSKEISIWLGTNNVANAKLFINILSELTDIQIETLRLVGNGLSNVAISHTRFVTEKSVEQIVTKISQHFGVGSDSNKNQRVLLASQYYKWSGALRD
ncbi:MAG: response regulator [Candidatus Planktophila sp.]